MREMGEGLREVAEQPAPGVVLLQEQTKVVGGGQGSVVALTGLVVALFVQKDAPDEIGRAIADWIRRLG